MSNSVVVSKSLEERLSEKLQAQIGDILTADDLKKIVDRGVEEFLFKPRTKKSIGYYRDQYEHEPPLVQELVQAHLKNTGQRSGRAVA